jgi:biopolymer transport protein ExbD
MVTAPLLTQAIRVDLPKTAATPPVPDQKIVALSIDAQRQIYIDKKPIAAGALEGALKAMHERNPDLNLHVYADEHVPYGDVARMLAASDRAGISKLAFVTVEQRQPGD